MSYSVKLITIVLLCFPPSVQVYLPRPPWSHWPGWSPPTRRSSVTPVTTSCPCPTRPWSPRCCGTSSRLGRGPWPLLSSPPSSSSTSAYSSSATGAPYVTWCYESGPQMGRIRHLLHFFCYREKSILCSSNISQLAFQQQVDKNQTKESQVIQYIKSKFGKYIPFIHKPF